MKIAVANRWSRLVMLTAGELSAALGLVVIIGWHTHNQTLLQIHPHFIAMVYNTALCFFLCGVGLFAVGFNKPTLAVPCGVVVAAIGLLILVQHAGGIDLGIDQLLMTAWDTLGNTQPGRMAPSTALCFVFAGIAVLLMRVSLLSRMRPFFLGLFGCMILSLGVISVSGYLVGIKSPAGGLLSPWPCTQPAGLRSWGSASWPSPGATAGPEKPEHPAGSRSPSESAPSRRRCACGRP